MTIAIIPRSTSINQEEPSGILEYNFQGFNVRIVVDGDEILFVAKDVAEHLQYSNPRKAVRDHCKASRPAGGNAAFLLDPQTVLIPERDVYRLVMRSRMPEAERFEEWVVDEVLPSIRKTGTYTQQPAIPQTYATALLEAGRLAQLAEEQAQQLALAAPKVEFVERYVEASGDKGFREVCKLLKVKEPEFRQFLSDRRIMYRLGGQWMPYQNHIDAGRFTVKTGVANNDHAYNTAKFTPKGIEWVAGEWAKHSLGVFS